MYITLQEKATVLELDPDTNAVVVRDLRKRRVHSIDLLLIIVLKLDD